MIIMNNYVPFTLTDKTIILRFYTMLSGFKCMLLSGRSFIVRPSNYMRNTVYTTVVIHLHTETGDRGLPWELMMNAVT